MKNRSWQLFFLLFWLIPALACNGGASAITTPTAVTKPKATATSGAGPKATATRPGSVQAATATAGATSASAGQFGPITFSAGVQNNETAVDPLNSYPDGVTLVYAVFDYSGMQDDQAWRVEWKHDGQLQEALTQDKTWKGGESGSWWISIYKDKGIGTGAWELSLYLGDSVQQTASFTIEPNPASEPDFGPVTFAPAKDSQDKPVNPLSPSDPTLPAGTSLVYAFFDGIDVAQGTAWTSQWFLNGESITDPKQHSWGFGPTDNDWISFGSNDNTPLTSGTYELKLNIGPRLVNIATYIMP